ncbi:MAG: hypothetical protein CVU66_02280 [Deltaproteobacteria bacterium HGW-Deltaproteobacteria-23]|jgi:hypothetical protein|nr:MAG: hypothetical protein CVU66_02280 [Deltaproteobacteria bacterium HGW-Deltaproteobacteria-23]
MHEINPTIESIKRQRGAILARRETPLAATEALSRIRRVVVINSSSRSGSSLLYALLGKLPHVLALTGEASPFYKLNSFPNCFNPHDSERIPSELLDRAIDFAGLARDLRADIYCAETATSCREIDVGGYCDDLMLRFLLQWTDIDADSAELRLIITATFDNYAASHEIFNTEEFYLELLDGLCRRWPQINPFYYDIGTDRVALRFPSTEIPCGPPVDDFTIEEPPFILLHPRKRADNDDLSTKTLLLKSTVDCYRMNLVERLLPQAEIRIIHLVRNPAATINGIFDGWHHRGFFSHNLARCFGSHPHPGKLEIKGYSDLYPFGNVWWNFDLPKGWQEFAKRELVDVCAFQWLSANAEILDNLAASRQSCCTVHFEDIIRSTASRKDQFARILDFMEISAAEADQLGLDNLPVVQSTLPPQLYRWKKRQDIIARLLDAPQILEMSERLGYYRHSMESWL